MSLFLKLFADVFSLSNLMLMGNKLTDISIVCHRVFPVKIEIDICSITTVLKIQLQIFQLFIIQS